MPLSGTAAALAEKIVDALLAATGCSPNLTISTYERDCMIEKWTIICQQFETHYISNTDVLPGTFADSGDGDPVTGIGELN